MATLVIACFESNRHPHLKLYIPQGPDNPGFLAVKHHDTSTDTFRMTRGQVAVLIALFDAMLDDLRLGLDAQAAGWRQFDTLADAIADDGQAVKPDSVRTALKRAESRVRGNVPPGGPFVWLVERRPGQGVRLFPTRWELTP